MKSVSDLRQVGEFFRLLWFPQPINLTTKIYKPYLTPFISNQNPTIAGLTPITHTVYHSACDQYDELIQYMHSQPCFNRHLDLPAT